MESIKFSSLEQLYNRIYPALSIRCKEFSSMGLNISTLDIWNYFTKEIWPGNKSLTLYDMVNDIFNCDGNKIKIYSDKVGK